MKTLKVKSILFSLLAIMAVAVLMTSCEQELDSLEQDTSFIVQPPLADKEVSSETDFLKGSCSTIPSSKHKYTYRNCTSKYVYAFGTSGQNKRFELYQYGVGKVDEVESSNYYAVFYNLQDGAQYQYKAIRLCPGGHESSQPFSVGIGRGGCR